jgi:hypothetical protein
MRILNITIALFCVVGAVCATTMEKELRKKRTNIKKYDLDSDGALSKTEFFELTRIEFENKGRSDYQTEAATRFANKDLDGDGFLTAEELVQSLVQLGQVQLSPSESSSSRMPSRSSSQGQRYSASLRVKKPAYQTSSETAGMRIYQQWLDSYGIDGGSEDPDSDGLSNLIEYALGSNPVRSDADGVLPESDFIRLGSSEKSVYIFRRRTDAQWRGLKYDIDFEGPGAATAKVIELDVTRVDSDFDRVTILVPDGTEVQLRIRID